MAEKLRRYNITDEQLHIFIKNSHGFVENYAKLYLKIYIADCVADRIFNISSERMLKGEESAL